MPLPESIAEHHAALARIVARLFALLGLPSSALVCAAPARIAKTLHYALVRALRPTESAVRRMIVYLAAGLKSPRTNAPRPLPAGLFRQPADENPRETASARIPAFQLYDPRPPLLFARRPRRKGLRANPRITFFNVDGVRTLSLAPPPREDDGLQASAQIVRRLQALRAALENLPRQARRLKRLVARRELTSRRKLAGPLRPGRPPGFRRRGREEIDAILRDCDWLARQALPNTS